MGNSPSAVLCSDWRQWFVPPDPSEGQMIVPINRNTNFRAPLEANHLENAKRTLKDVLKRNQHVRSVVLDLHVPPCSFNYKHGATVNVQPLINAHLVRYLVPALIEYTQEAKCPLVHLSIPLYGMGRDPADMLVAALAGQNSLVSLTLMHVTDEALLTRIFQAIIQHNMRYINSAIMEVKVVYEMDTLSENFCKVVCELLATDTLYSLQLSKNKHWNSEEDWETGINDAWLKQMFSVFPKLTRLSRLDLSNNNITDKGGKYLWKALSKAENLRLTVVNLSCNRIDHSSVRLLYHLTLGERNFALRTLDLSRNRIAPRTFVKLMSLVEDTLSLETLALNCHDFNLGAYRLKQGVVTRVNNMRETESSKTQPLPHLNVEMSGNAEKASFGYWVAIPSWLVCGVCCLLQGPWEGKETNLTNIVQGKCSPFNRGGILGMLLSAVIGFFLFGFAFAIPFVFMENDDDVPFKT